MLRVYINIYIYIYIYIYISYDVHDRKSMRKSIPRIRSLNSRRRHLSIVLLGSTRARVRACGDYYTGFESAWWRSVRNRDLAPATVTSRYRCATSERIEPFSIALSLSLSLSLSLPSWIPDLFLPLLFTCRDNVSLIPGNPKRGRRRRGRSRTTGVDLHDRARRTDSRPHRSSILGWVWI